MHLNRVRARQLLYSEGNGATHLHAIRSGRVKLYRVDAWGDGRISAILGPGDLFGLEAIFDEVYGTDAESLTAAEICLASADQLNELMAKVPRVGSDLARHLHGQLARSRDRQIAVTAPSAAAKLAGYLLHRLAEPDAAGGQPPLVDLDLTLKDLGSLLGLTAETTCRALSDLRSRGIVERTGRRLRVLDLPRLRLFARR